MVLGLDPTQPNPVDKTGQRNGTGPLNVVVEAGESGSVLLQEGKGQFGVKVFELKNGLGPAGLEGEVELVDKGHGVSYGGSGLFDCTFPTSSQNAVATKDDVRPMYMGSFNKT